MAIQTDYVFKQLWGKVILNGMHPIGQILNFDDRRQFQNRRTKHMHAPTHIVDAPKTDENKDSEAVEFIDKYITCGVPDETKYPEMSNLVKKVQNYHHATTCKKKKGVTCRFNAHWAPTDKTRIVCSEEKIDESIVKQSRKLIDKVLSYFITISDLSDVTLSEISEKSVELHQNSMTMH